MSQSEGRTTRNQFRRRRRIRSNSPFGDEDVPQNNVELHFNDNLHNRLRCQTKTAFVYDEIMLKHENLWDDKYFENPERIRYCYQRLCESALLRDCYILNVTTTSPEILQEVHSEEYLEMLNATAVMNVDELKEFSSQFEDVYFNNNTKESATVAVGSVIEAIKSVLSGWSRNAFCLIRPPGHHAMQNEPAGYCLLNNVAIGAKYAQLKYSAQKILILDWDVHHGNGTQYAFYDTSRVLYISIHRYDKGNYWPKLKEACTDFIGQNEGKGYNINIPLNGNEITENDYLAIMYNIVLPIAFEYNPDLVLVSAGFDAAIGDPEGSLKLQPALFAHLTYSLFGLASGRIILVLEGGYCKESLSDCVHQCLSVLMGKPPPKIVDRGQKFSENIREVIHTCWSYLYYYWRSLSVISSSEQEPYPAYVEDLAISSWNIKKNPGLPIEMNVLKEGIDQQTLNEIQTIREFCPIISYPNRTCFVYDCRMENHMNELNLHPESPRRTQLIYQFLLDKHILSKCKQLESRSATVDELKMIHTEEYIERLQFNCTQEQDVYMEYVNSMDSVYMNQHSYSSALLSTGSLLNVVDEVCQEKSQNGFAVIRPPGHHAESHTAMGFCFFNNVAIAAKYAQKKYNIQKVLIIDWDVHHGNGTQNQFWEDDSVLFISIHRYDNGKFYPSSTNGDPTKVGSGKGEGYNINIAWNKKPVRDTEYMAAFINIVMPVAYEFNPDLVLVSCGFDGARGDPLGGLAVTPECFSHMTQMICSLANGKVILSLEGGYNLNVITECMGQCVTSLLGYATVPLIHFPINKIGLEALRTTIKIQRKYWNCLKYKDSVKTYTVLKRPPPSNNINPIQMDQQETATITESFNQLAIVEVAYQAQQSVENSIIQQPLELVNSELLPDGTRRLVIHDEVGGATVATDTTATITTAAASSLPPTSSPALQNREGSPSISVSNTGTTVSSTSRPMSPPPPESPPRQQQTQPMEPITLSVQDLINLTGASSNAIQDFIGLSPSDPLPNQVYAVQPRSWCEHLNQVQPSPSANEIDVNAPCSLCDSTHENWVCLTCYQIFCGRYVRGHMMVHFQDTRHALVLSFADLSSWCYECDSYIHNEQLNTAKREAHIAKFGVAQPE